MSSFEFDPSGFLSHLSTKEIKVFQAEKISMHDTTDDLKRISSGIAPIKDSNLRKTIKTVVKGDPSKVVGEVTASVTEKSGKGRFNYALWTHEKDYNLGELSRSSPGTDGYHVGNKYLERPLKGESEKYVKWWASAVSKVMD